MSNNDWFESIKIISSSKNPEENKSKRNPEKIKIVDRRHIFLYLFDCSNQIRK